MDNHSSLNGFPRVLVSSSVSTLRLLETSLTLSDPLSESSLSASQKIVPLAESSMILPLGAYSVASVAIAFGKSRLPVAWAFGANSIAASGSWLISDTIRA